jgi:hypothetical protein
MFDVKELKQIEQAHQFVYPTTFWERYAEFRSLAETEHFRKAYPNAQLVGTNEAIRVARLANSDLPQDFIPFLIVPGLPHPDYYGFPITNTASAQGAELPVLVWCLHTYVHSWDGGFATFLNGLICETNKKTG